MAMANNVQLRYFEKSGNTQIDLTSWNDFENEGLFQSRLNLFMAFIFKIINILTIYNYSYLLQIA